MLQALKNKVIDFSGCIAAALLVPMVIIAIVQVGSRYLTDSPVTFTEELLRFLLIWAAMFGAVYCFGTGRHLALGFLAEFAPNKAKIPLALFSRAAILLFCLVVLIYGGVRIVAATTLQLSATMRVPMSYVYSILPISGVLIAFIVAAEIIELAAAAKGGK